MNTIPTMMPNSMRFGMRGLNKFDSLTGVNRRIVAQNAFANGYDDIATDQERVGNHNASKAAKATADAIRAGEIQTPTEACAFYDKAIEQKLPRHAQFSLSRHLARLTEDIA